jgi:Domain of unknown function (DUF4262)
MVASPKDEGEQRVFNNIEEYGSHIINVIEDDSLPGFAYSIGHFWKKKHPEIIVIGLKADIAKFVLNEIGRRIRKNGETFEPGNFYDGLIDGFPCQFFQVDKNHYHEYVGWARWFYEGNDFSLLQCVYPSMKGAFPWDEDTSDWFKNWQPVLAGGHATFGTS